MTEKKRPVLTLNRKGTTEPALRRRKQIVHVSTPPAWKEKKQRLAEKAARAAERTEKRGQLLAALKVYQKVRPLSEAVALLKAWWPGLFGEDEIRPMQCGIREVLFADIDERHLPVSRKQVRRALNTVARSEAYRVTIVSGASRFNPAGEVCGIVTDDDERNAKERLHRQRRQNARKAGLLAALGKLSPSP
ncbi:fertility inhibition protein FinO [Escherichia coli]|uniref:Fertility inhibition protein n=1 Tax=Escherichia coli TA447 TaxID=656447 RepID=A0A1X3ITK3_ECOLX|nr:fertility inhibition protein FinO [Escherichia coli]OSK88058.1 fertility inhibition protein (Conjugal transfer repressor) [Escherichia coli TA447]